MIRASVFLACAASLAPSGSAKPAPSSAEAKVLERAVAAATSAVGSATSLVGRSVHHLGGKAMRHRRLAEAAAQCAWQGDGCDTDEAFLNILVPPSGMLRTMYEIDETCSQKTAQQACLEVDDGVCSWHVDEGRCGPGGGPLMRYLANIMGNPADCGPFASFLKCSMYAADDPGCAAASECVVGSGGYVPEAGVCKAVDSCEARDPMGAFCPSFDPESLSEKLKKCIKDSGASLLEAALEGGAALMAKYSDCIYADCPTLAKMMKVTYRCAPNEDEASCSADAKCKWVVEEGEASCQVQPMEMVVALLPETCKWRGVFEVSATCASKPQDACSGGCEATEDMWCDESAAIQSEFMCGVSTSTFMEGMLATSNAAGVQLYNFYQVSENCQKMTNESACSNASVELEPVPATDETSGAAHTTSAVLTLLGAALCVAILTF